MIYGALAIKLSPPLQKNSTEHPKLIYMEMSCSAQNICQINLIFYENVLGTNCLRNEPLTSLVKLSQNFKGMFWVPILANAPNCITYDLQNVDKILCTRAVEPHCIYVCMFVQYNIV